MFRMCGNTVEIYHYKLTYEETKPNPETREDVTIEVVEYAISDEHKDALLDLHKDAKVEKLNTENIEWINGLEFDSYDEALQALERGYYIPKRSPEQLQADIDYLAMMTGVEL